jgi:hypothetical protein
LEVLSEATPGRGSEYETVGAAFKFDWQILNVSDGSSGGDGLHILAPNSTLIANANEACENYGQ